jgi:hypothetical protein
VARVGAVIGFCGLLLVAGCGKSDPRPRFTVQGKVTLDGQPLTGGAVYFFPILDPDQELPASASVASIGELGDDGSFKLSTAGKSGAPVGKYRVRLGPGDKSDMKQWAQVPGRYTQSNSPLMVEVVENKPEGGYDIQLSSKDKPKVIQKEGLKERLRSKFGNKNKP